MLDKDRQSYVVNHEFFAGLDEAYLQFLCECAGGRTIEEGRLLFQRGELATQFYVVENGRISIQVPAIYGPPLEIQTLGSGDILGWSWLIAPYRWHFDARADEDSALLEFDGQKVLARCDADPGFGYELLKRFANLMSQRLDAARQKMIDEWNPPGFA